MDSNQPLENIKQIRSIMERSTTFVSLSGLSGIAAGAIGLATVGLIIREVDTLLLNQLVLERLALHSEIAGHLLILFMGSLVATLLVAFALTAHRAKKDGLTLWNQVSRRFAFHLFAPLVSGGLFILALAHSGQYEFICPAMLLFFGLALVGAGHLTIAGTTVLGVVELILGVVGAFETELGLILWGCGFGLATATYGLILYLRYER